MLIAEGLCKHYTNFTLEDVSFRVPEGTVVGLIGENGAGKSTVIKSILGAVTPDRGTITFHGTPLKALPHDLRQRIAFVLDDTGLPQELTLVMLDRVFSNLFATWKEERFRSFVQRFELPDRKPIKEFSKGMKMKAAIAVALSYESDLLVLDEPTSGLDPVVRDEILDLIYEYNQNERNAVLISSHITSDLEKICDYIVYLRQGKVVFFEEKDVLLSRYGVYSVDAGQLNELERDAVVRVMRHEYTTDVLALRDMVPGDFVFRPAGLDDIMLFYAKGERI